MKRKRTQCFFFTTIVDGSMDLVFDPYLEFEVKEKVIDYLRVQNSQSIGLQRVVVVKESQI